MVKINMRSEIIGGFCMDLGVLAGSDFKLTAAEGGLSVENLTADSRQVRPGSVFFAIQGSAVNGAKIGRAHV